DLQRALDRLFAGATLAHFSGVRVEQAYEGIKFSALLVDTYSPAVAVPPEFEDVDVGEERPVRCLKNGLWLLRQGGPAYAVLMGPAERYGQVTGVQFQVATPNTPEGARLAEGFFRRLEEAVQKAESYRGKVLSLEQAEHAYTGEACGIKVHRPREVAADQIVLP